MADITRGETFVDGEQVTGARLNNHVTGAVITETFISGKTSAAPAVADWIVYWKAGVLRKTQLTNVVGLGGAGTVTSVGLTMPTSTFGAVVGSPVTGSATLEVSFIAQNAGEVLVAPVAANGVPTWRRLAPRDLRTTAVAIASSDIDWNLGDVFYKIVTVTPQGFTMSNSASGRTIDVLVGNGMAAPGPVLNWEAGIYWPGGVKPTHTTGNGKYDWYRFVQYGSFIFGVRLGADLHYP